MARPKRYIPMLAASRDEASLAVRLYNDPSELRSFEGFIVHMHLAWLYLLHAWLTKSEVDFRYRRRDNPRFLERVDGEPKRWELSRCAQERWPDNSNPTRANLMFFVALRNKIEHRYVRQQCEALTIVLGGQSQALLLNYEEELAGQFGLAFSMATRLRFPVFIGSFTDAGEQTLLKLRSSLPAPLRRFITEYHAGLGPETTNNPRYEFRLRVLQELAPRHPDALAVQFSRYDDLTDDERDAVEQLGRKGQVIVRERIRDVVGADELSPTEVVRQVQERIPFRFTTDDFQRAWKRLGVRPKTKSKNPERTDEKYCTYHKRHKDYGYKSAYVEKLVRECKTDAGFTTLTGKPARPKESESPGSGT
jgi:hypothetical protein